VPGSGALLGVQACARQPLLALTPRLGDAEAGGLGPRRPDPRSEGRGPSGPPCRFAVALLLFLAVDFVSFGMDGDRSIPPALEYPAHGTLTFLQAQPELFRMLALGGGLPPNTALAPLPRRDGRLPPASREHPGAARTPGQPTSRELE